MRPKGFLTPSLCCAPDHPWHFCSPDAIYERNKGSEPEILMLSSEWCSYSLDMKIFPAEGQHRFEGADHMIKRRDMGWGRGLN